VFARLDVKAEHRREEFTVLWGFVIPTEELPGDAMGTYNQCFEHRGRRQTRCSTTTVVSGVRRVKNVSMATRKRPLFSSYTPEHQESQKRQPLLLVYRTEVRRRQPNTLLTFCKSDLPVSPSLSLWTPEDYLDVISLSWDLRVRGTEEGSFLYNIVRADEKKRSYWGKAGVDRLVPLDFEAALLVSLQNARVKKKEGKKVPLERLHDWIPAGEN
jgi:hypothetical protein